MDSRETKRTVPVPSVGADGEQPNSQTTTQSIAEETAENNPQEKDLEEMLRDMRRMNDPAYLHTVSMNDLYQNIYQSRPPVIDGLLYPGTYLFAGAPKVGKSFLMAQLAYHVSTGLPLWDYPVHKGTVLYRRMTNRLVKFVLNRLTDERSFTSVAREVNLSVSTIIRIFDLVSYPKAKLPKVLSVDEFKGNTWGEKYQCILTDPENKIVLDILPERYKPYLTTYFCKYPKEEREKVKYFVSDMWRTYYDTTMKAAI